MSSHFNYEIDERNLRVRLKDMKVPYKEEAWLQFEMYSESTKANFKTSSLPRFQLNLNRSVILPVVFGIAIIAFSLLLFNFVSIKNKPSTSSDSKTATGETKTEEPEKEITPPEVKNIAAAVVNPKIDSALIKPAVNATTIAAVPQPSVAETKTVQAMADANKNTPPKEEPKKMAEANPNPVVSQAKAWTTTETAEIFVRPDNKSEVVGSASSNRAYEAIEETNYYIKVNFTANGSIQTGYIKKMQLRKNSDSRPASVSGLSRKGRKAEVLEPLHAPTSIPSEEKEPELK